MQQIEWLKSRWRRWPSIVLSIGLLLFLLSAIDATFVAGGFLVCVVAAALLIDGSTEVGIADGEMVIKRAFTQPEALAIKDIAHVREIVAFPVPPFTYIEILLHPSTCRRKLRVTIPGGIGPKGRLLRQVESWGIPISSDLS